MTKAKTPKGLSYTVIQTVMYDDPSTLHEDKETYDSWVNDELTWEDVYSKKPVEYLEAIARGETPRWNTELGKYVYGDSTSSEESFGGSKTTNKITDPQINNEPDEDLPF